MVNKIADLLAKGQTFSFEFFPPKSDAAASTLQATLAELEPLNPSFVSFTYGAGGATRGTTRDLVVGVNADTSMVPMAHLTVYGHTRDELAEMVGDYAAAGVANIMALRGDRPKDFDRGPGDLRHAIELVELIREIGDFSIGVAAHPEGHPENPDRASDRAYLAEKLAVADFAVTQMFFRVDDYVSMVDDLRAAGVDKPVIPGIMPVESLSSIQRMAELSGAAFPPDLAQRFYDVGDDPDAVRAEGVAVAVEFCRELLAYGVPGLHFFTLNKSRSTREIYENLGLTNAT